jgi:GH15 family glucan-1,4-alpha-glucosidase
MPRIDAQSCFGRLLDWKNNGYCQIAPIAPHRSERRYLEDSLILETTFRTDSGCVRLIDFFPMRKGGAREPREQIIRIVEGLEGSVEICLHIEPRFLYGKLKPWMKPISRTCCTAIGGSDGLLFSGDFAFEMIDRHTLRSTCILAPGQRRHLSILYKKPALLDRRPTRVPAPARLDKRLGETIAWWKKWASRSPDLFRYPEQVRRSALVLKGLTNAPSGAVAAAATTSLPEAPGGVRNWDYRFTWIRDSCFAARSLAVLGFVGEADGFRRFIERSAAGSAEEVQVLFGVGGERHLIEWEIPGVKGYRESRPVRAGNAAEKQLQLDVFGELLDLAWRWHARGHSPDSDYWDFIVDLVNATVRHWRRPDRGIWECRGKPRHFVHSKAMCWVALDRGIRLASGLGRDAPLDLWQTERDRIRRTIEERGYDPVRGVFLQAFGYPWLDSALLLLPTVGFIDFCDERMIRTTDAIRRELDDNGLLLRYPRRSDDLPGDEGAFLACSFWLSECLARQNRMADAHRVFDRALAAGNDLGLFSEQFDTRSGEMRGNFPQGLTHLSLISAAIALSRMQSAR